jgi:hypothetical protein
MLEATLNPDWYRVRYSLAVLHGNRGTDQQTPEEDRSRELQTVQNETRSLAAEMVTVLVTKRGEPELTRLLRQELLPVTLVLYGGSSLHLDPEETITPAQEDDTAWIDDKYGREQQLLLHLKTKKLTAGQAFCYARSTSPRHPRVLYNLACSYAQRGELDRSEECLFAALTWSFTKSRRRLAQWALTDPSLVPLLKDGHRPRLADVRRWAKDPK